MHARASVKETHLVLIGYCELRCDFTLVCVPVLSIPPLPTPSHTARAISLGSIIIFIHSFIHQVFNDFIVSDAGEYRCIKRHGPYLNGESDNKSEYILWILYVEFRRGTNLWGGQIDLVLI